MTPGTEVGPECRPHGRSGDGDDHDRRAAGDACLEVAARLRALPRVGHATSRRSRSTRPRRRGSGRARSRFRAAAMGRSTSYTLRYDYAATRRAWAGCSSEGDIMRSSTAATSFEPRPTAAAPTSPTTSTSSWSCPLPGLRQAPGRAQDHRTPPSRELKAARSSSSDRAVRILLFTGKGGVGKTTTAAATALRCADAGAAHDRAVHRPGPLAGRRLRRRRSGRVAAPIADDLWGQQLDAQERMEEALGTRSRATCSRSSTGPGVDAIEAEELSVVPGPRRGLRPRRHQDATPTSGDWDVVVVDCAPTAETIRFLSLPDILALVHGAAVPGRAAG